MTDHEITARTGPLTLPQPGLRGGGRHRRGADRPWTTTAAVVVLALVLLVVALAALAAVT